MSTDPIISKFLKCRIITLAYSYSYMFATNFQKHCIKCILKHDDIMTTSTRLENPFHILLIKTSVRKLQYLLKEFLCGMLSNCMNIEYCTRILKKPFKMGIMNKQFQRNSLTCPWWHHQMVTFSVSGNFCGEFIGRRWIHRTKASDTVLFDLRLNKR